VDKVAVTRVVVKDVEAVAIDSDLRMRGGSELSGSPADLDLKGVETRLRKVLRPCRSVILLTGSMFTLLAPSRREVSAECSAEKINFVRRCIPDGR
jgi:hypothetical protein